MTYMMLIITITIKQTEKPWPIGTHFIFNISYVYSLDIDNCCTASDNVKKGSSGVYKNIA